LKSDRRIETEIQGQDFVEYTTMNRNLSAFVLPKVLPKYFPDEDASRDIFLEDNFRLRKFSQEDRSLNI